ETELTQLLINGHGAPYQGPGIKSMMDRLTLRAGFRVHAHAFRHTFATVAAKLGWNSSTSERRWGTRLRNAAAVRSAGYRTRPGPASRLARADRQQSRNGVEHRHIVFLAMEAVTRRRALWLSIGS